MNHLIKRRLPMSLWKNQKKPQTRKKRLSKQSEDFLVNNLAIAEIKDEIRLKSHAATGILGVFYYFQKRASEDFSLTAIFVIISNKLKLYLRLKRRQ